MLLHLGHFVQRPSGISRFFDLEDANFGFLTNVVWALLGGGVTAAARSRLRLTADLRYVRSRYGDPGAAGLVEAYVAYLRAEGTAG